MSSVWHIKHLKYTAKSCVLPNVLDFKRSYTALLFVRPYIVDITAT